MGKQMELQIGMRFMRRWEERIVQDARPTENMFAATETKRREIRERMAKGVIGAEIFQQNIERRARELRRPKRGRPRK